VPIDKQPPPVRYAHILLATTERYPVPARFAGALRLVPFRSCSRKSARNELAIASPTIADSAMYVNTLLSRNGYSRQSQIEREWLYGKFA
jgi:hypothetical protein